MPAKSEEIRNSKQRERQQKLRDADRKAKRPGRDDVARTALFMTISAMAAEGATETLGKFKNGWSGCWSSRASTSMNPTPSSMGLLRSTGMATGRSGASPTCFILTVILTVPTRAPERFRPPAYDPVLLTLRCHWNT